MPINPNQTILSANIENEININLGTDNTTKSSKVKLLADAFGEEVFSIMSNTDTLIRRMYTTTSGGRYLDANGAEWNVFRGKVPSLTIDKADNVISIVPISTSDGFDDVLIGRRIIVSGEQFEIGGKYLITVLEDVIPTAKYTTVPVLARLELISEIEDLYINSGVGFRLRNETNIFLEYIGVRFSKPVSFTTESVDDETFRINIEREKLATDISSETSVRNAMSNVPNLSGHVVKNNEYGSGSIAVYFVTTDQVLGADDLNYVTYLKYVKNELLGRVPGGITINIVSPNRMHLLVRYINSDNSISPEVAEETIRAAIVDTYNYSETQSLDASILSSVISRNYTFSQSLKIDSMALFDPILNEIIIDYTNFITIDHRSYISISSQDIEPVLG